MTHDPTTAKIESDIAAERKALADSLSELTDQFAPERLVETVSDAVRTHGGDLLARANPVAVGLIGAGLAWLVLDGSRRPAAADEPGAEKVTEATRSGTSRARGRGGATAAQMREALHDGTEGLGEAARRRVIAAREQALRAQTRIEAAARTASAGGQRLLADRPLLVGAAVAVAGAAAAMALPRTRLEDETFGARRDALVRQADRILHAEIARAGRVGTAVRDEAGEKTLRGAADRLAGRARSAARS